MPTPKKPAADTPPIDPNSRSTISGPAGPTADVDSKDDLTAKMAATQALAAAIPFNVNKPLEYDREAATAPPAGRSVEPPDPIAGSSTVQETNG